jgi:dienelactone hydrolase
LCAVPGDFEDVCVPLSIALREKDSYLGKGEVRKVEKVMEKKRLGEQVEGEVVVYEDQVHGFALLEDQEDEKDKKAFDDAAQQGIGWFRKHLS